ncbi:MAG: hypothetical protein QXP53_02750 [Candidatus Pacearchaeota archaeon]
MLLRKIKNKKAQIWALDLAIGLMVFVGLIFMFYRYSISFVPEQTTFQKMIKQGAYITGSLLHEGYPPNWAEGNPPNIENVKMFGLLSNGTLNKTKWMQFCEWSNGAEYSKVKEKLGTEFAFYIYFDKDNDGNKERIPEQNGCSAAGNDPDAQPNPPTQLVKIERLVAYYDGTEIIPMKMILKLWSYGKT